MTSRMYCGVTSRMYVVSGFSRTVTVRLKADTTYVAELPKMVGAPRTGVLLLACPGIVDFELGVTGIAKAERSLLSQASTVE